MRRLSSFFLLFSFLQISAQTWTQLTDFPGIQRDDGCSFTIGNLSYCGTGVVPNYTLRDFYSFDMRTEKWDTIAAMPKGEQRQYAASFSDDSLKVGYVLGGYNGGFLNDLWQYNTNTNQWTQKTALPGFKRSGAASFVIGHVAYIIGGKTASLSALSEVWAYDMIQDKWQQKRNFPFGSRWRSSATSNDSLGYLIFGLDSNLLYQAGLYKYDPSKDKWTKMSDFPKGGRNYSTLQFIPNKLITFGGEDSTLSFHHDIWAFDLQGKSWMEMNPMPAKGRRGGICFHSKDALFYTTGLAVDKSRYRETWKWAEATSIIKNNLSTGIKIFPNPASSNITIDFSVFQTAINTNYFIYNIKGKLMSSGLMEGRKTKINIEDFPAALYFVVVKSQAERMVSKLLKQ